MLKFRPKLNFPIFMFGFICYMVSAFVFALPQVESRTGSQNTVVEQTAPLISTVSNPSSSHFNELNILQKEVSSLKGQLEEQEHELKQLKKSQQDLYLDLDRRLSQLQSQKTANKSSKPEMPAVKPQKELATDIKTTPPKTKEVTETLLYQGAYNMVKTKRYAEAITEFQKYLSQFPKGEHVVNAHYWLGEMYVLQWQGNRSNQALLDKAEVEFSTITTNYPNHTKTADAVLKLGLLALDKGDTEKAKQHFSETKLRYPGTSAARIAETRLSQLP